jgi:transcription termination factor NusB
MKYLSATEFEKIFEPVTEDDENHLLTINLSHNVFQQLVSIASSNKKAISDIITDFVTNSCDTVQAESAKINK